MAVRPVFLSLENSSLYRVVDVDFVYNKGMAVSQKKKNIVAIHDAFKMRYPSKKTLEISSKSLQEEGVLLSAFNLKKFVPSLGKSIPVENVYQGGKKFSGGGPYTDLYSLTPREAKLDERLQTSGELKAFYYEGKEFPLYPKTSFYDYIYINALLENEELAKKVLEYDAFTDIEFNPSKSVNCQARAAAIFVSLYRMGLIDKIQSFDDFLSILK